MGAVAGLVAGVLLAAAVSVAGWLPSAEEGAPSPPGPAGPGVQADPLATEAFLVAWERGLMGTWRVASVFERRSLQGRGSLQVPVLAVQRPPDRLVTGFGSTESRLDGRILSCTTDPLDRVQCRGGGPARPYDEEVQREVALLRRYVSGPTALYAVTAAGEGCFRLTRTVALPAPPYGDEARFCFDGSTGATVEVEIRRPEAIDTTVAVEVSGEVRDADLQVDASP